MTSLFCDPGAIRTLDPRLRRALLYPAELRNHHILTDCKDISFFTITQEKQKKLYTKPYYTPSNTHNTHVGYT